MVMQAQRFIRASKPIQVTGMVFLPGMRIITVGPGGFYNYTTIGAALTYAATLTPSATNRVQIWVAPGVYTEALTLVAFVDLVAMGTPEQTTVRQADATIATLISNCSIKGFTFDLNAPSVARNMIVDGGVVRTGVDVKGCIFTITTPGAFAHRVLHLTAASAIDVEECEASVGGGATAIVNIEAAATVNLRRNDFGIASATGFAIRCTAAATLRSRNNAYSGVGGLINASLGTVLFEYDSNDTEAVSTVTGGQTSFKNGFASYEVFRGMLVAHALAAVGADTPAPAAGNRYEVQLHPGTYSEALAPTVDHVTLVGLGPPGAVIITQAAGNLVTLNGRINVTFKNVTLQLTAALAGEAAVALTTAANTGIRLEDVIFDLVGAAAGNALYGVNSSSAFAHTVTLVRCSGTIGGTGVSAFVRETTGTLTATLEHCLFVMNSANGFIAEGAATVLTVNATECSFLGTGALVTLGAVAHRVTVNGGEVDMDAASVLGAGSRAVWKTAKQEYKVVAGLAIQHAIAAAAADTPAPAAGSRYTVRLAPGLYVEALTMSAFVDVIGTGAPEDAVIRQADATVVTLASNSVLQNVTVDLNAPSAARNMVIDNAVALAAVAIRLCVFTITTPGAFAHRVLHLTAASAVTWDRNESSVGGGATVILNVEAAATLTARNNDLLINSATGFVLRCTAAATINLRENSYGGIGAVYNVSLGTIISVLDAYECDVASTVTGGSVTAKKNDATFELHPGLLPAHAIAAAVDGDVILVYPGTYAGSSLTPVAGVSIIGVGGWENCRFVANGAGAPIFILTNNRVTLKDLWIENTGAAALDDGIELRGAGTDIYGINLRVSTVQVVGFPRGSIVNAGAVFSGTAEFRNCRFFNTGVAGASIGVTQVTGTVRFYSCHFQTVAGIDWTGPDTGTTLYYDCTFQATATINVAGGAGVGVSRHLACDFIGIVTELGMNTPNGKTVSMEGCDLRGTAINSDAGRLNLANCRNIGNIDAATTGQVRLFNSDYRRISRTGTGIVIDESPRPAMLGFRALLRLWDLIVIANQNIATRLAIGGAVLSGGPGQTRLRINDNAADAAGTEQNADAAGSLASTWTPARCPRYVLPISAGAFRATTSMFFGLRATLGAAVPGMAEHHAGFIWTGAAFNASSSNGGGVGEVTALATPSTGVHHQLEVIVVGGVQVEFYVDGALVATHAAAAGVPTAALSFQEYEISTGAGGATNSDITLREGFIQETPS